MRGGRQRLLGRWGEAKVAEYLSKRGYKLLAAGWRCRFGEIDLIATDGKYICFTEVKLRKDDSFAPARAFVNTGKQNRLRTAAGLYLVGHPTSLQPRFDVAEVYAPRGTETEHPEICYLENAFE